MIDDDDLLPRIKGRKHRETWYGTTRMVWSLDHNDFRRMWQDVTPKDGLTLRQAMLHFDQEGRAERFWGLEAQGYGGDPPMLVGLDGWPTDPKVLSDFWFKSRMLREDKARLEFCLIQKLITGHLQATGYTSGGALDEPARPILGDRWRTLTPDFETSQATDPGVLAISGILVFEKQLRREPAVARRVAPAELRRWYKKWVRQNLAEGNQPSRERDLEAACEVMGASVPRELVRSLRRELAPEAWTRFGRRRRTA